VRLKVRRAEVVARAVVMITRPRVSRKGSSREAPAWTVVRPTTVEAAMVVVR
jgi:hypothetical protein